jgi:hypothetical protein
MTLWFVLLIVLSLAVAFGLLIRRLSSRADSPVQADEWLDTFAIETYAPLGRLMDDADYEFLARQPGYTPSIARVLRAERRKVLTGYLRLLVRDFNNLLAFAKTMLVQSGEDQPEFATSLLREQARFYFLICVVYCDVRLSAFGAGRKRVDELVTSLGRMQERLRFSADAA